MAIYWYWCEERGWPNDQHRDFLADFIPKDQSELYLWGEGAIPQLLIHLWYLRSTDARIQPDLLLASLLRQVVSISVNEQLNGLPSPYYGFEDVMRHILRRFLVLKEDPFQDDTFSFASFFALSMMQLLVRTNLKETCRSIWPSFSRLGFKHFEPSKPWMYCLRKVRDGKEITEQPKLTKEWRELAAEARDVSGNGVPRVLRSNKHLFILFLLLFPYRGTPSAIRYLGREFNETWFIEDPIP